VFLADYCNSRIRKIDHETREVSTFAGSGENDFKDGPGNEACFSYPNGIAFDSRDNLYVADGGNHRIRRVDHNTRAVTTVAGTGDEDYKDGPAHQACFFYPGSLAIDAHGDMFVADAGNNRIRCVNVYTNQVSTVAGSGEDDYKDGLGIEACFNEPSGIVVGLNGDIFVSDYRNNRIRCIHNVAAPYSSKQLLQLMDALFAGSVVSASSDGTAVIDSISFMPLDVVKIVTGYITP
jgi:hypothetical protein